MMAHTVCFLYQPPPPSSKQRNNTKKAKALSLGVSPYSPWDLEMANKGYEVLEFDASIEKSPYPHHSNIKFFKQFVGVKDSYENGVQTIALERIIKEFNFDAKKHNILQCDIENAEWAILEHIDISVLERYFSQLIFEFHELNPDDEAGSKMRFKVLEKLNKHFVPIWVHYNSYGGLMISDEMVFCSTVEVSYIRKDLLPQNAKPVGSGLFRLGIDTSNNPQIPDIPVVFP